jgi:hypothetical protein
MSQLPIEELLIRIQHHLDAKKGVKPKTASPLRYASVQSFSKDVYNHLDEASVVLDGIQVESFLSPSKPPLIGGLWQRVRLAAHNLVLFYVNQLAGMQKTFNQEILEALTSLVSDLDTRHQAGCPNEIHKLRDEVGELRAQVEALRMSPSDPNTDPNKCT